MPIPLSTSANIGVIHDQIALKSIADTVKEKLVICIAQMRPYFFFLIPSSMHIFLSIDHNCGVNKALLHVLSLSTDH